MQARRAVLWRLGLTITAVVMAGCVPSAHFDVAIGIQPTVTFALKSTPTVAYTPTVRPTATETVIPSPTPESFPIDKAKLFNNMPKGYEELTPNLGNYVEAPDATTPEFMDWWKNVLLPTSGPEANLTRNAVMTIVGLNSDNNLEVGGTTGSWGPLQSQPEFFYSRHGGKVYPGLVLSTISYVGKNLGSKGTVTVIPTEDPTHGEGWDSLANLAAGKPVISVRMYTVPDAKYMPADCPTFIAAGLDGSAYWEPGVSTPEPSTPGKNTFYETGDHWFVPACGRIQTSIPK